MAAASGGGPVVSIVVPVFEPHEVYFRQAIESVLNQSFSDLELIVVEDPSRSSGRDLLGGLRDSRMRHIVNRERTSLSQQHNRGLSEARGAFICRFDADDICEPERVERELAFLRANPRVDVVGSCLTIIDDQSRVVGERRYPIEHEAIVATLRRYNSIANSTVMFRREVYERFGGWRDSDLPAQDYEWYSRLGAAGARFANLPEPLVRYRIHGGSIKSSKLRDTIRTTIDVKQTYWLRDMDLTSRALMAAEQLLLLLPERLVLKLFMAIRYGRRR
ncbi:MAG TPA: glycosyltransferase [Vicinamibacterales bacterium]|jgi:glycosyltransferase involved in cell wall biosynthesis|nr:glycosyltransferase [Vicinamibacterales bacterium]